MLSGFGLHQAWHVGSRGRWSGKSTLAQPCLASRRQRAAPGTALPSQRRGFYLSSPLSKGWIQQGAKLLSVSVSPSLPMSFSPQSGCWGSEVSWQSQAWVCFLSRLCGRGRSTSSVCTPSPFPAPFPGGFDWLHPKSAQAHPLQLRFAQKFNPG